MYNNKKLIGGKSGMVFWEFIIIAFSFVIMGIVIFMAMSSAIFHSNTISLNIPEEIRYKFPSVFVHTFLMQELKTEDKEKYFGDSEGKYYIKDLIWLNPENVEEEIFIYKEKYLEMIFEMSDDVFVNYGSFSGKELSNNQYILDLKIGSDSIPDIRKYIVAKNYFFYIKTSDGSYTIIYFYNDGSVPESINDINRNI